MRARWLDALVLIYAILLIGLALYAYLGPTHHIASLIAGGTCGLLEIAFLTYSRTNPRVGRIACAVIALLIFLQFVGIMIQKGPSWNAEILAISSLIVVIASGVGHMLGMRRRTAAS